MKEIKSIIENFREKTILIVGDIMADKYIFGEVERISPEAPVQVVKVQKKALTPGGAANLANNVVAMGGNALIIGVIGTDSTGNDLLSSLKKNKIDCSGIIVDSNKPTTTKTRILGKNQQLLRLDYEDISQIDKTLEKELLKRFENNIKNAEAVVISDYDKGTMTATVIEKVIQIAKKEKKILIADTKSDKFNSFKGVDLITPNCKEASQMTGIKQMGEEDIKKMGLKLSSDLKSNVLITRAQDGMTLFEINGKILHYPTQAKEVYDVSGAGDTVAAAIALALAARATYEEAILIANQAAAIQVSKIGTATVSNEELKKQSDVEYSKVRSVEEVVECVGELRKSNKRVIFTNGCFDLLHPGHVKYLKEASKLGDILIVGLNTDNSVRRIKGEGRPVINEEQRAEMLSLLDFITFITFFDDDTPEMLVESIKPDIFVKGGDYKEKDLPEAKIVRDYGGRVVIVPFIEGYSSTKIINKIAKSYVE